MKASKTYLKGKSVFVVSAIVIAVTSLTVYFTGIHYQRSVNDNLLISLSIIAIVLFVFMTYGLFKGIGLVNNFPKFKKFKSGEMIDLPMGKNSVSGVDVGDGIEGLLISIVSWILLTIAFVIFLVFLEAVLWLSIFVILAMLYWVFFRALKLVFSKAEITQGHFFKSIAFALGYTLLYTGWIFAIIFIAEKIG